MAGDALSPEKYKGNNSDVVHYNIHVVIIVSKQLQGGNKDVD